VCHEQEERSVAAGLKVLVFTVDLATPERRYSEVHDGMEKDPTLLAMLGFVAHKARCTLVVRPISSLKGGR
jgi:isopentenyl diphosphate isomerase/L-lactate dehydrogenase-like FMN-dependent dehydrogenase